MQKLIQFKIIPNSLFVFLIISNYGLVQSSFI